MGMEAAQRWCRPTAANVCTALVGIIYHLNKRPWCNIVCQRSNTGSNELHGLCGATCTSTHEEKKNDDKKSTERTKRGLGVCADGARVDRRVWTFAPFPSTKWASNAGDASSGRGKFSFPCIKKASSPAVFEVLAAEAFPVLRNLTQNPLRGSCQHRLPGNRLLFSLCFQVQVGASWASLSAAPAEWASDGFRRNIHHKYNYWGRMIGIDKRLLTPPFPYLFISFHSPHLNSFHFPGSYLALSNLLTSLVITTRALYPADPLFSIKPKMDLFPISTNWRTRP